MSAHTVCVEIEMEQHGLDLAPFVVLLAGGIIAVTLFKRLGLGSVLGYLAAGLVIGPFGFGVFTDTESILRVAELGVVMFLFVIGLEMQPSRLWKLRAEIFGTGLAQVLACGFLLTCLGVYAFDLAWRTALIAAAGFALSSTAIVFQLLQERGEMSMPRGQRAVSILLLQDLAIVPLLAMVAFLAPGHAEADASQWQGVAIGVAAIVALVAAGYWLVSPMFALLAAARAREVMTAAALMVVLGAALLMEISGLSMAMGAFLAGVLLSESSFRHQLEADIEPFRGILLGLFFIGVGMSIDLAVVARDWLLIVAGVAGYTGVKMLGIYTVTRLARSSHGEAVYLSVMLAQGGEFAFVLYAAAGAAGLLSPGVHAVLTAIVILSMALTPLLTLLVRRLTSRTQDTGDMIEPDGRAASALIIGFGRVGQVASQSLLARGIDVTIIDSDPERIRNAAGFGFKVYFGDGTQLNVLRASGAATARVILVCVDKRAAANRIARVVKEEFRGAKLLVRSFDRWHALELVRIGVDSQTRETFEAAMLLGRAALGAVGIPDDEAEAIVAHVRERDAERFELELAGNLAAGRNRLYGNMPQPTPLTKPQREGVALNEEATPLTKASPDSEG